MSSTQTIQGCLEQKLRSSAIDTTRRSAAEVAALLHRTLGISLVKEISQVDMAKWNAAAIPVGARHTLEAALCKEFLNRNTASEKVVHWKSRPALLKKPQTVSKGMQAQAASVGGAHMGPHTGGSVNLTSELRACVASPAIAEVLDYLDGTVDLQLAEKANADSQFIALARLSCIGDPSTVRLIVDADETQPGSAATLQAFAQCTYVTIMVLHADGTSAKFKPAGSAGSRQTRLLLELTCVGRTFWFPVEPDLSKARGLEAEDDPTPPSNRFLNWIVQAEKSWDFFTISNETDFREKLRDRFEEEGDALGWFKDADVCWTAAPTLGMAFARLTGAKGVVFLDYNPQPLLFFEFLLRPFMQLAGTLQEFSCIVHGIPPPLVSGISPTSSLLECYDALAEVYNKLPTTAACETYQADILNKISKLPHVTVLHAEYIKNWYTAINQRLPAAVKKAAEALPGAGKLEEKIGQHYMALWSKSPWPVRPPSNGLAVNDVYLFRAEMSFPEYVLRNLGALYDRDPAPEPEPSLKKSSSTASIASLASADSMVSYSDESGPSLLPFWETVKFMKGIFTSGNFHYIRGNIFQDIRLRTGVQAPDYVVKAKKIALFTSNIFHFCKWVKNKTDVFKSILALSTSMPTASTDAFFSYCTYNLQKPHVYLKFPVHLPPPTTPDGGQWAEKINECKLSHGEPEKGWKIYGERKWIQQMSSTHDDFTL